MTIMNRKIIFWRCIAKTHSQQGRLTAWPCSGREARPGRPWWLRLRVGFQVKNLGSPDHNTSLLSFRTLSNQPPHTSKPQFYRSKSRWPWKIKNATRSVRNLSKCNMRAISMTSSYRVRRVPALEMTRLSSRKATERLMRMMKLSTKRRTLLFMTR